MSRGMLLGAAAGGHLLAGCGGETATPSPEQVAQCLRAGGASVQLNPQVSDQVGTPDFEPVLTPDTKVAVRGRLSSGSKVTLHVSTPAAADYAETRAMKYLRLFGLGRERLVRRDTALLLLPSPTLPARDREMARRCLE